MPKVGICRKEYHSLPPLGIITPLHLASSRVSWCLGMAIRTEPLQVLHSVVSGISIILV